MKQSNVERAFALRISDRYRIKEIAGCFKIVEVVGVTTDESMQDVPLTMTWAGLFKSKRKAVDEIERTLNYKFDDNEYRRIVYGK